MLKKISNGFYKIDSYSSYYHYRTQDRERCFASHRAEADYYERLLFSGVADW